MNIRLYQVDAFTDEIFHGNPAAVCPLESWLSDELMQKIAMENNLSETAFYIRDGNKYQIRWFTPTVEVDLCGHATLASAFVLFNYEKFVGDIIHFISRRSGELIVTKAERLLTLNFPADVIKPAQLTNELINCFDLMPEQALRGKTDYLLIYNSEKDIESLIPRFDLISKLDCRGIIVTAKGTNSDFVSRFFGPQSGVDEDPVTGSAHTTLTTYWAERLGKTEMKAVQLSARKGHLKCKYLKERIEISGQCRLYMKGEITID